MLDAALGQAALCTWRRGASSSRNSARAWPPQDGHTSCRRPADWGQESQPFQAASAGITGCLGDALGLVFCFCFARLLASVPKGWPPSLPPECWAGGGLEAQESRLPAPGLRSISRDHASWTGEQSLRSALGRAGGLEEDVLLAACNAWKPPRLIF